MWTSPCNSTFNVSSFLLSANFPIKVYLISSQFKPTPDAINNSFAFPSILFLIALSKNWPYGVLSVPIIRRRGKSWVEIKGGEEDWLVSAEVFIVLGELLVEGLVRKAIWSSLTSVKLALIRVLLLVTGISFLTLAI